MSSTTYELISLLSLIQVFLSIALASERGIIIPDHIPPFWLYSITLRIPGGCSFPFAIRLNDKSIGSAIVSIGKNIAQVDSATYLCYRSPKITTI